MNDDVSLINQAAKELYEVYLLAQGMSYHNDFELLPEHEKQGWIAVAEHAIKQSTELFQILSMPDHR